MMISRMNMKKINDENMNLEIEPRRQTPIYTRGRGENKTFSKIGKG